MTDAMIIRMLAESSEALEQAHPYSQCRNLAPSYNALLEMAKANHPADPFLRALARIDPDQEDGITVAELRVLFAQLRIALEALQTER